MRRPPVLAAVLLSAVTWLAGCSPRAGAPLELWLWSGANLGDAESVARTEAVWRRAAAAGYTTVLLSDLRFSRLGQQDPSYFATVERMKALAAELKLELVPAVFPVGRGQGAALAVNPQLAEALPVRNALFEVRGGVAHLVSDPPVALAATPDELDRGAVMDAGTLVIRDPARATRAAWTVRVSPHRAYRVSVQVRAGGFEGEPSVKVRAGGRDLAYGPRVRGDGEAWVGHDVVFHSLSHDEVTVHLGCGTKARGTLAWKDWTIEEIGPVNIVRRPDTPFIAEGLVEGVDFEPVRDSLLGASPWRGQFDAWHEPPVIRVRRPDGTRFRASWWSAAVLLRGQVALCLADTATRALVADEGRRVREAFGARQYLLQHDEIRAMGWDPACEASGMDPGGVLAANVRDCRAALAPARVLAWNDMFDPFHNAVRDYYLVNGDLAGGIAGLDSSVTIVNWNQHRASESLRYFSRRGHRQVFAGYYDGRPEEVRPILRLLRRTPGAYAVMYTTWRDRYDDLEAFAREVRAR